MHHGNPVPKHFRVAAALEMRWADAPIHRLQRRGLRQIQQPRACCFIQFHLMRRVEADIAARGREVEFAILQQLRAREDIGQEHAFPPARMAADDIGAEAFAPQINQGPRDILGAADGSLHGAEIVMRLVPGTLRFRVADMGDTGQRDILPFTQANHPRPRTRRDHRRQMAVLAGEILVNEKRLNQAIAP